jgi:hypothetical protein
MILNLPADNTVMKNGLETFFNQGPMSCQIKQPPIAGPIHQEMTPV